MNDKNRSRPRREGPGSSFSGRSRSDSRPTSAPRGASADELLDIADDLEAHGRALISQARKLQRLAESSGSGDREDRPRPQRGGPRSDREDRPRTSRSSDQDRAGGGRPPTRKGPPRGRSEEKESGDAPRPRGGGERDRGARADRPKKRSGSAPDWAPQDKRRRS